MCVVPLPRHAFACPDASSPRRCAQLHVTQCLGCSLSNSVVSCVCVCACVCACACACVCAVYVYFAYMWTYPVSDHQSLLPSDLLIRCADSLLGCPQDTLPRRLVTVVQWGWGGVGGVGQGGRRREKTTATRVVYFRRLCHCSNTLSPSLHGGLLWTRLCFFNYCRIFYNSQLFLN